MAGPFDYQGRGPLKPKFQVFSASGTFTPSAGLLAAGGNITVKLWGAGGGGGGGYQYYSHGFGGNAGNCIIKPLNISAAQTVTIGTGGTGGTGGGSGTNGTSGGNSTFGSLLTAEGGGGGKFPNNLYGQALTKATPNGTSIYAIYYGSMGYWYTGAGGSAKDIGIGGIYLGNSGGAPTNGGIASGGGGGASDGTNTAFSTGANYSGAAGGDGYCIVEWWE